MKRKVTRPDGTIEETEGTAEEFAALEKGRKDESKKKPRKVLHGKAVSEELVELRALVQRLLDRPLPVLPAPIVVPMEPWPGTPTWPVIEPYIWCGTSDGTKTLVVEEKTAVFE